jgi:hypothetical protein
MAPETASITDVCSDRAAHGAVAVRHVQVTPAAERARQPAELLIPHEHAHALTEARTRARTRARKHAARTRQMNTNTQMSTRTNAHAHCTHTRIDSHARAPETPVEDPAHPPYPLNPLGNPVRTPPYCVGTASAPRRHHVGAASGPRAWALPEYPSSACRLSIENREDRAVFNRARLEYPVEYPEYPLAPPSVLAQTSW